MPKIYLIELDRRGHIFITMDVDNSPKLLS